MEHRFIHMLLFLIVEDERTQQQEQPPQEQPSRASVPLLDAAMIAGRNPRLVRPHHRAPACRRTAVALDVVFLASIWTAAKLSIQSREKPSARRVNRPAITQASILRCKIIFHFPGGSF